MRRATHRIATLASVAALALLAVSPAAMPADVVRAADRGLVVVAQAIYTALPEQRVVHVRIDAVATSYTPNSGDGLSYYPDVNFAVQAGATHVSASSNGQPLEVKLNAGDSDFLGVIVTFADGVFFQESETYRVDYDLPDPGGAPDRNLRISPSIIAFPVWAFGSDGEAGSGVKVVLPSGFRPSLEGDEMVTSTGPGGEIILSRSALPDPFAFFAYLSADRPGAFTDTLLTVVVGDKTAPLRLRAWQDDPEWGASMRTLMTDGLPALQRLIGLPYPAAGTLVVEEAATSRLGEYAGVYNDLTSSIRVRYDADAYVGLHEAAHIWFNDNLFRDRWIGEAYAEFYGVQAATEIGATGSTFDLSDDLLANKIALNDWGEFGVVEIDVEEYAYAATYHLAQLIYGRTNLPALQRVWQGVSNGEMAYQPAHDDGSPEKGVALHLEGWQQLLDLLDERAGANFDDLWTEWVVNDTEQLMVQQRTAVRRDFAAAVEAAGAWDLPFDLRYAMGSWLFDDAEADLALVDEVLTARDQIADQADELHLTPPGRLWELFEGRGSLPQAKEEGALEIEVLTAIGTAADRLDDQPSLFESIGLIGADPQADLTAARSNFEADDLGDAADEAARALAVRQGAEEAGQTRALLGGGSLIVLTGGSLIGTQVGRRRRRRARAAIALASPARPVAAEEDPAPETQVRPTWPMDPPA